MESLSESSLPRKATTEEIETLINEVDDIPLTAWLLTFTGAVSQLARYGITVAWQNYLQNPRDGAIPGALGLGQAKATTIQNAYLFFQYLTPSIFAVVSDARIGRYKTMMLSLALLVVGYLVLMLTALPAALEYGAGVGGLAAAMVLIGLGQGGISAIQYPFIGDQIPEREPRVKRNKRGELVVTDRKLTVQYVFNAYYWMVNVASLSAIPTTLMEKRIDFWAAYLLPICILIVSIAPVIIYNKRLVKLPPQGNVLPHAIQVIWIAIRSRFRLTAADPEYRAAQHKHDVPWTSAFVFEIQRGLKCCRVIFCFVIFWLCYNQTSNNVISQAGQMKQQGISNDTIQSLNSIACIILGPIIQNLIFPFLRRRRVPLGPILRMAVGFFFIAAGLAYTAGLQQLIYSRGPCFEYPLDCSDDAQISSSGTMGPNDVSIWLQTPLHFLFAVGEVLALVSISEYTYTEAPTGIKAMVQALQNVAAAIGAALGMALGPVSKNPWLVIVFGTLTGAMGLSAALFWLVFRRYDVEYENRDVASSAGLGDARDLEEPKSDTGNNIGSEKISESS